MKYGISKLENKGGMRIMSIRFPKISTKFLKSAEFKARQLWLNFEDAVGTVLEVLEPVKESAWLWFAKWKAGFCSKPMKAAKPNQGEFYFYTKLKEKA